MKSVTIEIPDGKKAEWLNGVLTLVDEEVKDNRPVTERIKTFEDACRELGEGHPLLDEYTMLTQAPNIGSVLSYDLIAYLKLRIIVEALNEGWKPTFVSDGSEWRWYPWFYNYSKTEIEEMDEDERCRVVGRSSNNAYAYGGLVYAYSNHASSYSITRFGGRLAFKSEKLADYAGKQFIQLYADMILG